MTHQHGGRPGSGTHGGGKGASGGGAKDVGSRNWEIAHGIDVGGKTSQFARGAGNDGSDNEGYSTEITKPDVEKQPEKEETPEKLLSESWKLYVDGIEWDLSDVIDIDRPCRDYCYWIIEYKNGKETRVSGNVILEEI